MQKVCAIITAYNSGAEIDESVRMIAPQVAEVVVVDDHSQTSLPPLQHAIIIRNPENYGLGRALNVGIRHAAAKGCDWVITLDDNGKADPDMVEKMFKAYDALTPAEQKRTAVIAPNYTTLKGPVYAGKKPFPIITTITSGQLVKISAWDHIGGFNEEMIIAGIDHDFSFRLRRAGYAMLLVPSAILHETPGSKPIIRSLFGKKFVVPNYAPWRYYYLYRNNVYLYKHYFGLTPRWILHAMISDLTSFIKIVFFEDDAWRKTAMIARGYWDGLRGRMGKL